ncbi:MAG: EAL domain-containing protein, partial [Lachnospiraceae bacterium]|nr:EAL domain-containing protein [Lachnospiraceae bacterium]
MVTEGGFNENIVGDDVGQASIKINPLTGLYFSHAFFEQAEVVLKKIKPDTYCMVAVDLEHFRLFNKLYGRAEGDCLLVLISDLLKVYQRKHGGIVGYLGGDNFGILTVYDKELLENLYQKIKDIVNKWNNMVGFLPAFGIYPISETTTSAAAMYDRATVALSHVLGNYVNRMCEYYPDMDEKIEEEIRLLSEIQKALDNEEFIFYVQPQCDITTGKIVGGESLVRWKRGMKAIIPPGIFVPVLERNGFIADLDRYVWERVCKWLREWLDKGNRPVPISINVSRIDMFSMDVPEFLLQLVHKYNVPANLLKIEITESAYAENEKKIIQAVQRLRKEGFLVMMDDFGSGYSSLNMLKSISVDVLKMDMRFLEINEDEEEKGISILDSVINMARQMRIPVIVEGVENQRQENSLLKLECHYAQGYYYYRPMPIGDFEVLISDERKVDYKGIRCRQNESLHTREFLDRNLFNDTMVNNILGPAAFYEMYENNIEITRVNGQYYELAGIEDDIDSDYHKKFWNHVRDDDRQLLYSIFAQAYENPLGGAQGHIHFIRDDEKVLWVYMRVFFLREREGHKIFYGSLTDMTGVHHKHGEVLHIPTKVYKLSQEQMFQMEQYYGNLPCGYGIGKVLLDDAGM